MATAGASDGWWKPMATGMASTVGAKARPPRVLASISAASAAARFSTAARNRRRASGEPLTTVWRGPFTTPRAATSSPSEAISTRAATSAGVAPVTASMGESSPCGTRRARRAAMVAAAPIRRAIARSSTSLSVSLPAACSRRPAKAATPRMPWEWPTAETGEMRVRSRPSAASRSSVVSWVSSTPGRPSAAWVSSAAAGRSSAFEPLLGLERARQRRGDLSGHGLQAAAGLLDQLGQARGVRLLLEELGERREPVGPLASEGDGELLATLQPVRQRAAALGAGVVGRRVARGCLSHMRSTSCSPPEPEILLAFLTRLSSCSRRTPR